MKCTFVAINAKYIHTNLALRYLLGYAKTRLPAEIECQLAEFSINNQSDSIMKSLYRSHSQVFLFSCYIWNIQMVSGLAQQLREIDPACVIIAGGPEVSYHADAFLQQNPAFDFVICGEGEETTTQLLATLHVKQKPNEIAGIAYRLGSEINQTAPAVPLSLDKLPFPYPDIDAYANQILYYESSRGCPFSCSYCLSSIEKGVRFRSLPQVFADLKLFLDAGVRQVKFVDRTFNCDKRRAQAIWKFLEENDNGITNFHFELEGHLLDEEIFSCLANIRPRLFQFEIGVQSTHPATLEEIHRSTDFVRLSSSVSQLIGQGNIHVHLDLIAGLPLEDYKRFSQSFNDVMALRPHQLQMGFLKVLKGSEMEYRVAEYGLRYQKQSPFEVLTTNWLNYEELLRLKDAEAMVDFYYNSGRFSHILNHLLTQFPQPFALFEALGEFYVRSGHDVAQHSKTEYYTILWDFMADAGLEQSDYAKWLSKFDLLLHEKPNKLPEFIDVDITREKREAILAFYDDATNREKYLPHLMEKDSRAISRLVHLEVFPFDVETGEEKETAYLFVYQNRSITGRAHCVPVVLPK